MISILRYTLVKDDFMERINELKTISNSLLILTFFAITYALQAAQSIILPFCIAGFCYILLNYLSYVIHEKFRIPKLVAVIGLILLFTGVLVLSVFMIASSISSFSESAIVYKNRLLEFVKITTEMLAKYDIVIDRSKIREVIMNIKFVDMFSGLTGSITRFSSASFLVFLMTLFLFMGKDETQDDNKSKMLLDIEKSISNYLLVKFMTSGATAILVGALLAIYKVDLALTFSILVFLLNFIPSVGSIIASIIPVPVLLLQFGFGVEFVVIMIVSLFIQFLVGNIIEPKIMGDNMGLHSVVVLLFLLFWGFVWGIPGMFLAVPITSILKLILMRFERTQFLASLMEGKI